MQRLALNIPLIVAQKWQSVSKLKTVKPALFSSTSNSRLFDLILLDNKKDLKHGIDVDCVVENERRYMQDE